MAGLWSVWEDKATGEEHESYTMLTLNADGHQVMGRMHKPESDPKTKVVLPLQFQDKRSVIPIEAASFDQWLEGTVEQAQLLLKLAPVDIFDAGPAPADPPKEPKPRPERAQPKSPPAEPSLF